MKKYLVKGASTLLLGGFLTSCSHDEFDISTYVADKVKAYEQVFVGEFGSIDPNQDWGFGSVTRSSGNTKGLTRAVFSEYWDGVHNSTSSSKVPCGVNWTDTVQFTIPSGLETVDANTTITPGKNYYVPSTFNGKVKFGDNYSGSIYVAGKVTGYEGGNQQNVNIYIYEKASWTSSFTSGTVNFYNNGYLTLGGSDLQNSNIAAIYNAGSFTYTGTNTNSSTYFYSTGTVELTADNVDFKLKSDIHNTMKCKNVKIQNGTAKYICGIEATGKVENVDGPLVTSNVIADELSFDGNPVYLTQGGHIKVATTISLVNSNSHVYAVENSTALVETVNFKFGNKNDLTHTFSDNIYFKVSGKVDVDGCYAMGSSHNFATVDEYLAYEGHNPGQQDEYPLAKERVNAGNAAGSPACGSPWSIGTGGGTPEPGEDIEIPIEDPVGGETITKRYYKTTQLIEQGRVFCEDLGQISSNDLDFNDVVFDAYISEVKYLTETTYANGTITTDVTSTQYDYEITLWAAGGTLALQVAEKDVKNAFGSSMAVSTIINTAGAYNEAYGNQWAECKPATLKGTSDKPIGIGDLPIVIQYSNREVLKLDANLGQAPHKICVPIGTKWPKERQKIAEAYKEFGKYVTNGTEFWKGPKDDSKLYVHPEDNATERSTEIMEEDLGTVTETESSAGGYNNTEVLSRPTK